MQLCWHNQNEKINVLKTIVISQENVTFPNDDIVTVSEIYQTANAKSITLKAVLDFLTLLPMKQTQQEMSALLCCVLVLTLWRQYYINECYFGFIGDFLFAHY